jgi:citrate lyase beta subunit
MFEHLRQPPAPYAGIRSIIETPILDEYKWAKIPTIPADAFLIDLEDAVPAPGKERARDIAVEYVKDPSYFDGRVTIARPNHLSTPWGAEDIDAFAEAGVKCMAYPKLETAEELIEVQELLRSKGADPDIFAIVETSRAVLEIDKIAAVDKVVGIMFGSGDLSVDAGIPLFGRNGLLNPAFEWAKLRTVLAGAAYGRLTVDVAFLKNLRDLDEVRVRYTEARQLGFTTGVTFYPPHVPVLNDIFGPSAADLDEAEEIIATYEAAIDAGNPAVTLASGKTLLVHDYEKALRFRERAASDPVEPADE